MIFLSFLPLLCYFLKASTAAVLSRAPPLPPLITLEEHFYTPEIAAENPATPGWITQKLLDLDGLRIRDMDQGRVTKQ